jgi:archaellum biogenesis ATPase FlaH
MISNFTNDDVNKLIGLFHQLVNRNQGMYRQVEDLAFHLPYQIKEKILDVCDNSEYADFLGLQRDFDYEQKFPQAVRFPLKGIEDAIKIEPSFEWIVEPLFSKGSLSVIVGASGSMKTYAMLHAGLCIAAGKQWLGFPTKQTPVLYVDEESGEERISLRIKQIVKGESLPDSFPFKFSPTPRLNFTQDEHVQLLRDQIVQYKFRLVIIDSMIDVIGDADENSANAINPVMMRLSQLAKETKAAIVLIHHTGKDSKYRGTSAIPGSVDLMLYLKKDKEKSLTFSVIKARDIDDDLAFSVTPRFGALKDKFCLVRNGIPEFKKSEAPNAETYIIEYLNENPNSTIRQISDGLPSFDYDYLRLLTGKMEDRGLILNTSGGGRGKEGKYQIVH